MAGPKSGKDNNYRKRKLNSVGQNRAHAKKSSEDLLAGMQVKVQGFELEI